MSESRLVIAVDLDDVLCCTNVSVAEWHNKVYGTDMGLKDFHYYHYWKNQYWGDPLETAIKVKEYYLSGLTDLDQVAGALEGVQELKKMGYELVVVTARHQTEYERSKAWLDSHFPNVFRELICTGQFRLNDDGTKMEVKIGKPDVCKRIGARLIVDDSVENAAVCAASNPALVVLLFGEYEWNKRLSKMGGPKDHLSYDQRLEVEGGVHWWEDEVVELEENVRRVRNWSEVVEFVRKLE